LVRIGVLTEVTGRFRYDTYVRLFDEPEINVRA
jgi:hypothetical protein